MKNLGILNDGQYGIESILKAVDAANAVYDLFEAVYLDDKKLGPDDAIDLVTKGPALVTKSIAAFNASQNLDEEIGDLSENEKGRVLAQAGSRFKKPGYQKILRGMLDIADGISELKNPNNPTASI